MLEFKAVTENCPGLLPYLSEGINSVEAYTDLLVNEDKLFGEFWVSTDEEGSVKSISYNCGDGYRKIFGDEFPSFTDYCEDVLMFYNGACPNNNDAVKMLTGKEILAAYKLFCGGKMSFDDEKRYVMRLRCVNKGIAAVFGIYSGKELVSTVSVSGKNEKYAMISDVFTKKEFRGRALAATAVNAAVSYALNNRRIPVLRCKEEMCRYYEKSGFVYYGKM